MSSEAKSRAFVLPQVHASRLRNGLKVYAVPSAELPLVSLHLILPSGAEADPPGKAGLADFAAEMLTLGTQKRSAAQLAAEVDGLGATLSAHSGWNSSALRIFGLSEDLERLLGLLLETYTQPAFSPEEFDQLQTRRMAALVQQQDESEIIADERFQKILFQGSPYDHPVYGTLKSLPNLSCQEAREFYHQGFLPEGSFVVAVGDLQVDSCCRWLEDHSPATVRRESPEPEKIPAAVPGVKVFLIDRPDLTQSQIRLGHLGIPHVHPDFVPFEVMNYILGAGGFSSRLMQKIRSELGYTYGIRASLEPRKYAGPFTISTFTPTETTFSCVREIFSVIQTFISQGATEKERGEAINFFTGSYPMKFETPSQIAQKIIQTEIHGLGLESLSTYPKEVASVTLSEITRSTREYIHPEKMLAVIVGRSEKFRREFEQLGPVEITE